VVVLRIDAGRDSGAGFRLKRPASGIAGVDLRIEGPPPDGGGFFARIRRFMSCISVVMSAMLGWWNLHTMISIIYAGSTFGRIVFLGAMFDGRWIRLR